MKSVYILVEGQSDAAFLRRVLPEECLSDAEVVIARGGIPSLARSLLVLRRVPVAVLIDSDSLNPEAIEERRQGIEDLIRAADSSIPVKVVSAVPMIEAWFFAAPQAIQRLTGQAVSAEWLSLGRRDPKRILQEFADRNQRKWDTIQAIQALETHDIEQIRTVPEIVELSGFLLKTQKSHQAA